MDKLADFLLREWNTLKDAPLVFFVLLIFGIAIGLLTGTWLFKAALDIRDQRLLAKDDLIAEYRERLHLVPGSDKSSFSLLTNKELKEKTFLFVKAMREFRARIELQQNSLLDQEMTAMRAATSEEERNKLWEQHTRQLTGSHFDLESQYSKKFRVDAVLIRDELLTRLPTFVDPKADHWYELPGAYWSSLYVADDLERLGKILPESSKSLPPTAQ